MALEVGSRLGHYDVTALIGEGGMGQVYQATDTKLNRQVALKILPEAFATDPDRLARFQREAQVLASLNHPNIAAIHGLEESGDVRALVLELVEGPTLADRIGKGPIPVDEALPIAKQIAEALEAAHEAGVIHRDLKPANIKVKEDGTVKVLDFGLAKALDTTPEGDPSLSPTLTAAATQMGVILGTAAYMSPEQARGKTVDKRADIWAFGVVLYEMLTGSRPFQGEDVSLTLASVMKSDVNVTVLPTNLPETLRTVIRQCLQKDTRQRVADMQDVRLAMEGAFETAVSAAAEPPHAPVLRAWQHPLLVAALALIAIATATWALVGGGGPRSNAVKRFVITLPESDRLPLGAGDMLAISPDGRTMVYAASRNSQLQLFRRSFDEFEPAPIPNTDGARMPFFSADGRWVGFFADGALQKVALAGGPAQILTPELGAVVRGAHWGTDDMIVYGLHRPGGELMQVAASGGSPTPLFTPDDGRRARFPHVLPTGDVLFTLGDSGPGTGELRVFIRETGEDRMLLPDAAAGRLLATGHLVFVRLGALWGVPFDLGALETIGDPIPLVEAVRVEGGGAVQVAIGDDGSLVYFPGESTTAGKRLLWVNRQGERTVLSLPERFYRSIALSPNGDRAVFSVGTSNIDTDVWVSELARGTLTPMVTSLTDERAPIWTLDGRALVYGAFRGERWDLRRSAADGTGDEEILTTAEDMKMERLEPSSWSPDGNFLVISYSRRNETTGIGLVSWAGRRSRRSYFTRWPMDRLRLR